MESFSKSNAKKNIYHPDISLLANFNEIEKESNFFLETFCSSCNQIVINPEKCKVCNLLKCKECPAVCEDRYKYEPYNSSILHKLSFYCENKCGEIIPYEKILDHHDYLCPKYNYKTQFDELSAQYKAVEKEYKELQYMNDVLNKNLSLLLQSNNSKILNIVNHQNESPSSLLVKYHKHPLISESNDNRIWSCDECKKRFRYCMKSFFCDICDYDLCLECILSFLMNN